MRLALEQTLDSNCCEGSLSFGIISFGNEPIGDVNVTLWNSLGSIVQNSISDTSGNVSFQNLCLGTYRATFSKSGYRFVERNESVSCNSSVSRTTILQKNATTEQCCGGEIRLTLRDASNNLLQNSKVRLDFKDTEIDRKSVANGSVKFTNLCQGEYNITVSVDGYKRAEFTTVLGCDETQIIERTITK
jgi:hypothetical protein